MGYASGAPLQGVLKPGPRGVTLARGGPIAGRLVDLVLRVSIGRRWTVGKSSFGTGMGGGCGAVVGIFLGVGLLVLLVCGGFLLLGGGLLEFGHRVDQAREVAREKQRQEQIRSGTWPAEVRYDGLDLRDRPGNFQLLLEITIRPPYQQAARSIAGQLQVCDKSGQVCWQGPVEFDGAGVSFQRVALEVLRLDYQDQDPKHRALRFDHPLAGTFTPARIVWADGSAEDLAGNKQAAE